MGKELVDVAKGKALDERTDWIIKEIIQDRVLVEIWEQNQILLDEDTELDFTLLQRESYLIAKSLLMDCIKTWGNMDAADRCVAMSEKSGVYSKIDRYMNIVTKLENEGRKRYIARTDVGSSNVINTYKDAKSITVESKDGVKVKIEKGGDDE